MEPSKAPSVNILLCSVGRRVELVKAFKQAYQSSGWAGQIVGLDINPLAPALWEVDRPYIVPRLNDPHYIPTLLNICQREKIDLVLPLIDYDIPVLAAHQAAIEATGARVGVIPAAKTSIVNDKWETFRFFQHIGVPTPQSWLPEMLDYSTMKYPLFVKPRHGSASQHTYKIGDARELAFFVEYVPDPIVQEYVPGPEITNDVICDFHGRLLGFVSRKRVEVRSGEVNKGVTLFDQAIGDACRTIARELPAVGPITVQCMMRDDQPLFTEINARLGGGIPLGIAAGVNSPLLLLQLAAGVEVDPQTLGDYQTDLFLSRFDDSRFLTTDDCNRMAQNKYTA
ncbi:MAG: ATP-grasp domain-containing protein [Ardenticatenaceae bacterium]|nr:ATP-grasp domain-containing protein [Ardenticatenaceae bacterium]